MTTNPHIQTDIDALAARAVAGVGAALMRPLSEVEAKIALALFWARAAGARGEWIDIDLSREASELVIEPMFLRGYIALAVRVLGRGSAIRAA